MEPCYEYLGCDQRDCIAHGRKDGIQCWELNGTLCSHPAIKFLRERMTGQKKDACARSGCIYFKQVKLRNPSL